MHCALRMLHNLWTNADWRMEGLLPRDTNKFVCLTLFIYLFLKQKHEYHQLPNPCHLEMRCFYNCNVWCTCYPALQHTKIHYWMVPKREHGLHMASPGDSTTMHITKTFWYPSKIKTKQNKNTRTTHKYLSKRKEDTYFQSVVTSI